MYISKLSINGYRCVGERSIIHLNKGLNILIGENGCGKTTIIDAIRLLFKETSAAYACGLGDFYLDGDKSSATISIGAEMSGLSDDDKVAFLTWCSGKDSCAEVHLDITESTVRRGLLRRSYWGGVAKSGALDQDTFEMVECIYLPALRDAEKGLSGRYSVLSSLIRKKYGNDTDELVRLVNDLNQGAFNGDGSRRIRDLNDEINRSIVCSMGKEFGQSVRLQFSEATFNRIIENIKMIFSPDLTGGSDFRDLSSNSLGYNNFLYIATIMSELEIAKESGVFTILLVEEPEAHLHPQLQVRFMKYLEQIESDINNVQIIATTHSVTLASSVGISKLVHLSRRRRDNSITSTTMSKKNFGDRITESYINRWLDATKSTMLFSRGVILVEGIAEAIVVPKLAELVLTEYNSKHKDSSIESSLDKMGVSVININGINFKYFDKLFVNFDGSKGSCIPIRCSNITDCDPGHGKYPACSDTNVVGKNPIIESKNDIESGGNVRIFISPLKTFEYDLACHNSAVMAKSLLTVWPNEGGVKRDQLKKIAQADNTINNPAKVIYECIDNSSVGKGIFASVLVDYIDNSFEVPSYIKEAVLWACGVDDVEQKETNN